MSEEEKKEFLEKIVLKQTELVQRCPLCFDGAEIIVNLMKKINVAKILRKLSSVMTGREVIDVIVDELKEDTHKIYYN